MLKVNIINKTTSFAKKETVDIIFPQLKDILVTKF